MLKSVHQFLIITILAATVGAFTGWCPEDCYGDSTATANQSHNQHPADDSPCNDCCPCPCNISLFYEEYTFSVDLPLEPLVFCSDITASLLDQPLLPLIQPPRLVS